MIKFNYQEPMEIIENSKSIISIFNEIEKETICTFSGKSAISLALMYFRKTGKLIDKSDQLLVPNWMGTWIYMTMHKFCFPTTIYNDKVKGLFVYHQWGFPQKMEEILKFCKEYNLFCIEDCAHSYESYYKKKRLGTFGDVSIFSLSKFFPCVVGGAIYSQDDELLQFVQEKILMQNTQDLSGEVYKQRALFDESPSFFNNIDLERNFAVYDRLFEIPKHSINKVFNQIENNSLNQRRNNYLQFKNSFKDFDYLNELLEDDVLPWILPLFLTPTLNNKIADKLKKENIESGIFNFDINRNMLEPKFIECIGIPCHQGITSDQMSNIINIIKQNL